jgi:transcriptional regulator of arginine metabolism
MHARPKLAAPTREERRNRIAERVRSHRVQNQAELAGWLRLEGIEVNQATLSRDLRDMGVLKGPEGYELPQAGAAPSTDGTLALYAAVKNWLASVTPAENLVVVKTPVGGASPLAVALDSAGHAEVLGTIAGDDTILIVTRSSAAARALARELAALREPRKKSK